MRRYSTRQAAKKLGLSVMSLHRYISARKIPAPPAELVGRGRVRAWTNADVERVRKILPKIANGRKTRYKKKGSKKASKKTTGK
jgi:predicted DNA-binding transcriptional regulator AlpA